jgi:hypothetical protein
MLSVDAERIGNSNAFWRPSPASAPYWRRPIPCQRLPRAAAPPTCPARRGSPVDAPRSQADRGAAQSGHTAQDGREEGQQGCPGAPAGKTAAAGVDANTVLAWLMEAAEQLWALSRYCLCDVQGRQVQLDELYTVLRVVKTENSAARAPADALRRYALAVFDHGPS